jgi:DNA mismatch repair protein PMS2
MLRYVAHGAVGKITSIQPQRIQSMCASKACRTATMIGDILHPNKMKQIIQQLGQLDQPWNCPHGRPTMRHLMDCNNV